MAEKKGPPKQKTPAKSQKPTKKSASAKAKVAPKKPQPKATPQFKPLPVKGVSRAKLKNTFNKYAPLLRGLPGVVSVGIGLKCTKGEYRQQVEGIKGDVGIPAIVIFVKEKPAEGQLKPGDPGFIPDSLDGVPTDVEPVPTIKPAQNGAVVNPLVGGARIAPHSKVGAWGTLGLVVRNNLAPDPEAEIPDELYYLTCSHVAFGDDQQGAGARILQPPVDAPENFIGTPGRNGLDANFGGACDAATVVPAGNRLPTPKEVGAVLPDPGLPPTAKVRGSAEAIGGLAVMKVGARTGLRHGEIRIEFGAAAGVTANFDGVERQFTNLIKIESTGPPFADLGDSGSVVFVQKSKSTLKAVGLIVGIATSDGEPGRFAYAQPLEGDVGVGILASLGVSL